MTDKPYGSGYFGEWIEDDFGLPAYHYTCDQIHDPKATTPVNPVWRSPTDHSFQVGNDRLVGVASNYGYIQVRQDEGSPKYLNDYDPVNHHYGGGFGYLTDGETILSTYYPGGGNSFERLYGVGYCRKMVTDASYAIEQVIFAPFGDDPLLISQVSLSNHRSKPVDLRWVEYWDAQMVQFSFRATMLSMISRGRDAVPDLRRQFSQRFVQHFSALPDGAGLLNEKRFLGYGIGDRIGWGLSKIILATVAKSISGGGVKQPIRETRLEDLTPPPTFLVSLDAPADRLSTDGEGFFGYGGIEAPYGLSMPLSETLDPSSTGTALLLERNVHLEPGESKMLFFAYGYIPQGFELESLLAKYRQNLPDLWARSSEAWKGNRIQLSLPGEPWVDRELTWHHYYLRSNLTFDSFFQEHILSQGHVYQYAMGFQGAARDPLQHALPFTFSQPGVVKEILRYTLKEVRFDGEIPYGIVGHGVVMPSPFHPSDLEMWLLWLASEYVLATRDKAFLNEQIPTYPVYGPESHRVQVRDLLTRCFHHLVNVTGVGKHGLLRISNGDWNDLSVIGFVPKGREEDVREQGESVLNAAFAAYTLDLYARMLSYIGDEALSAEARQKAEGQRQAVREQWSGRWFRRQWLTEDLGWIGEDVLWLEPQPWAIIGGAATMEQKKILANAIDELVRRPSPTGAMILSRVLEQMAPSAGTATNAGIWPSINGTLIWALAQVDGEMAWEEWKKNTLAQHAQAYPEIWYGIWSGPDTYNSVLAKYPGHTVFDERILEGGEPQGGYGIGLNWTDFPVLNMHPHAWPLYDVLKLMGVEFTPEGVELSPCLPQTQYQFASPLLGLERSREGYSGWYRPSQAGEWQITLRLPQAQAGRFRSLQVNGKEQSLKRARDGAFVWRGASTSDEPLRWEIR
jgi:hypothetical protein